jgi:acyl-coenzyme A synthetase/AMP-(fatty) acid ligase
MVLNNGPLFPAALAAILAQGGTPLLLHGSTPPSEATRLALQLGASFILSDAEAAQLETSAHRSASMHLQVEGQAGEEFATVTWSRVDESCTGFLRDNFKLPGIPLHPTSGSTGKSKIAARPGLCCTEEALHYIRTLQVDASDVFLTCVPMSHAYGYGMGMMVPMLASSRIVSQQHFNPKSAVRALGEHAVTIIAAVPAMLDLMLCVSNWSGISVRHILSAGTILPEPLANAVYNRIGMKVKSLYGTTETGGISIDMDDGPVVAGCVGRPMEGVYIQLRASEQSQALGEGAGQVWVSSSSIMAGYLQLGGLDISSVKGGWFPTGDLARFNDSGSIQLLARQNDIINVFGMKVVPVEVEAVLLSLEGVVDAKVYSGVHRSGSQVVKAAVVTSGNLKVSDVRAHCEKNLAPFKRPEVVQLLEALPRSASGKILIEKLP